MRIPSQFGFIMKSSGGDDENMVLFSFGWWLCCAFSTFLVAFAGIMSGLTLGLMSMSPVDLEVLKSSGTAKQKTQAAVIYPVVKKQHELLVTLLLCNAMAMEALPLFLDRMADPITAVILSVTFVLCFGEVIPQAICSRFGLAVGASCIWLVKVLMVLCFPISYPVGKLLDILLGHNDPLFRRNQLKALVSIHGAEAGRGGELTHDETTIISGALDLTTKTAQEAMTPIESTFSIDINDNLDWDLMGRILARGHSRVPVHQGPKYNIIGVLLVKSLLTLRPEDATPVSRVSIRRIPRMPASMPLYNVLNEFQKGSSHMAAVTKDPEPEEEPPPDEEDNEKGGSNHGGGSFLDAMMDMVKQRTGQGCGSANNSISKGDNNKTPLSEAGSNSRGELHRTPEETGLLVGGSGNGDVDPLLDLEEGAVLSQQEIEKEVRAADEAGAGARELEVEEEERERRRGHRQSTEKGWRVEDPLDEVEIVGIITLEDVIEELLQEEIVDETDEYIDVHKKIRVAQAKKRAGERRSTSFAKGRLPRQASVNIDIDPQTKSHSGSLQEPLIQQGSGSAP